MALCPRFLTVTKRCCRNSPPAGLVLPYKKKPSAFPLWEWGAALRLVADRAPFGKALFVLFQRLAQGGFPLQA